MTPVIGHTRLSFDKKIQIEAQLGFSDRDPFAVWLHEKPIEELLMEQLLTESAMLRIEMPRTVTDDVVPTTLWFDLTTFNQVWGKCEDSVMVWHAVVFTEINFKGETLVSWTEHKDGFSTRNDTVEWVNHHRPPSGGSFGIMRGFNYDNN